jgi:hypothetical protein
MATRIVKRRAYDRNGDANVVEVIFDGVTDNTSGIELAVGNPAKPDGCLTHIDGGEACDMIGSSAEKAGEHSSRIPKVLQEMTFFSSVG